MGCFGGGAGSRAECVIELKGTVPIRLKIEGQRSGVEKALLRAESETFAGIRFA